MTTHESNLSRMITLDGGKKVSQLTFTLLKCHPELEGYIAIDTVGDGNCGPRATAQNKNMYAKY
jgi:hypothetical protein